MTTRCLFVLLLPCACSVTHLDTNAPGNVRVHEKPEVMEDRAVEQPLDPGEEMLLMRYGVMAAGGAAIPEESGDSKGSYGFGLDYTVLFGKRKYSHDDDSFLIVPDQAFGGGFGWTTILHPGHSVGPVYAELEYASGPAWLSGGWAVEIDDELHGPQALVGYGPFFVRYTHLLDQGGLLHFWMAFKGQTTIVWNAPAPEAR
jgi:hypothetical protein